MTVLLITCEHGGNKIPREYRAAFRNAGEALNSHRGWDPGTLPLARLFEEHFGAPLLFSEVSRLLVDLNRSVGHRRLFSAWSRILPAAVREEILAEHYQPHRAAVLREIQNQASSEMRVLHVAVHSFTPVLDGRERRADVGLLYDPSRPWEQAICACWRQDLQQREPQLRVLRNSPYRGVSDGLTSALRREHVDAVYAGIELEINQRLLADRGAWRRFQRSLCRSLESVVSGDR